MIDSMIELLVYWLIQWFIKDPKAAIFTFISSWYCLYVRRRVKYVSRCTTRGVTSYECLNKQFATIPQFQLVTHGIYSLSRHPSYAGWFYWSIGTQLLMCNPVCTLGYAYASWKFFEERSVYFKTGFYTSNSCVMRYHLGQQSTSFWWPSYEFCWKI